MSNSPKATILRTDEIRRVQPNGNMLTSIHYLDDFPKGRRIECVRMEGSNSVLVSLVEGHRIGLNFRRFTDQTIRLQDCPAKLDELIRLSASLK